MMDTRLLYGISEAVVAREELLDVLDDIEAVQLDYYVSIRNMYMQRRTDEIQTVYQVTNHLNFQLTQHGIST